MDVGKLGFNCQIYHLYLDSRKIIYKNHNLFFFFFFWYLLQQMVVSIFRRLLPEMKHLQIPPNSQNTFLQMSHEQLCSYKSYIHLDIAQYLHTKIQFQIRPWTIIKSNDCNESLLGWRRQAVLINEETKFTGLIYRFHPVGGQADS